MRILLIHPNYHSGGAEIAGFEAVPSGAFAGRKKAGA